jgi:uncharacterized protein YdhG (YjbR/CyaY superfamily)
MIPNKSIPGDIDLYIAGFPEATQQVLKQVRATIRAAAPDATEIINYGIPTFFLKGNLVHFAGYKNHIGFYPTPSAIDAFKKELSVYKGAKGSVQFPLDKPMPLDLIRKITQFRVKQHLEKTAAKTNKQINKGSFLALLPAPARRALENKGITTLKKLSSFSETEILGLHGMGPGSIPTLLDALKQAGLSFKENKNPKK